MRVLTFKPLTVRAYLQWSTEMNHWSLTLTLHTVHLFHKASVTQQLLTFIPTEVMIPWDEEVRISQSYNKSRIEKLAAFIVLPALFLSSWCPPQSTISAGVPLVIFESFPPRGFNSSDRPLIDQQFASPLWGGKWRRINVIMLIQCLQPLGRLTSLLSWCPRELPLTPKRKTRPSFHSVTPSDI